MKFLSLFFLFIFTHLSFAQDLEEIQRIYNSYLAGEEISRSDSQKFQKLLKTFYSGNEEKSLEAETKLLEALSQAERFKQDAYLGSQLTEYYFGLVQLEDTVEKFKNYVLPLTDLVEPGLGVIESVPIPEFPMFYNVATHSMQPNPQFIASQANFGLNALEVGLKIGIRMVIDSEIEGIKATPGTGLLPNDVELKTLQDFLKAIDLHIAAEISGDAKYRKLVQTDVATKFLRFSRQLEGLRKTPSGVTTVFHWESSVQNWLSLYYSDEMIDSFYKSLDEIKDIALEQSKNTDNLAKELNSTLSRLADFKKAKQASKSIPRTGLLTNIVSTSLKVGSRVAPVDVAFQSVELLNYYANKTATNNPNSDVAKFAKQVMTFTSNATEQTAQHSIGNVMYLTAAVDNVILNSVDGAKDFFKNPTQIGEFTKNITKGLFDNVKILCNNFTKPTTKIKNLFRIGRRN